jgi:hypothetical protein
MLPTLTRRPTIYEALRDRIGREPTSAEITAECRRILAEGTAERAEAGKLPHQRKRR